MRSLSAEDRDSLVSNTDTILKRIGLESLQGLGLTTSRLQYGYLLPASGSSRLSTYCGQVDHSNNEEI